MKADVAKPDAEGEYVENIIERQRNLPRTLPDGSLMRLYFLSPNSRYSVFVGFLFMLIGGMIIYFQRHPDRFTNKTSDAIVLAMAGSLVLVAFGLPLVTARRISRAIQFGVSAMGSVDKLQIVGDRNRNTYAGMQNGRIKVSVSYSVNGQHCDSEVFLDRPWVRIVEVGTQLRLLIDPNLNKPPILWVIGIAGQGQK